MVDVKNQGAECVSIDPSQATGTLNTSNSVFVQFSAMDNYITVSPQTWASIQTYIGQLKILAQQSCK